MKSWRISCVTRWVLDAANRKQQKDVLKNVYEYYLALLLKTVPGLYKGAIQLHLKDGKILEIQEFMSLYIYHEIFIEKCYDVLPPGDGPINILDVGANTGYFAIFAKQQYPSSTIHCYEPYWPNYKQLQKNISLSKLENVLMFQEGVSNACTTKKLFIDKKNIGGHSIYPEVTQGDSLDIHLVDLGVALDRLPGSCCDLLKLDCEGAEYDILKSIDVGTANKIRNIVYEYTWKLYNNNELIDHLSKCGYEITKKGDITIAAMRMPP